MSDALPVDVLQTRVVAEVERKSDAEFKIIVEKHPDGYVSIHDKRGG
ncbi:MAG: hypothetical protein ACE5I2_09950 [Anaerolineae bacterium]